MRTLDRETVICLALTLGCDPWGMCCSLGAGIWDTAGSCSAIQSAIPVLSSLLWLWDAQAKHGSIFSGLVLSSRVCVVEAGNANPAPPGVAGATTAFQLHHLLPQQGGSPSSVLHLPSAFPTFSPSLMCPCLQQCWEGGV